MKIKWNSCWGMCIRSLWILKLVKTMWRSLLPSLISFLWSYTLRKKVIVLYSWKSWRNCIGKNRSSMLQLELRFKREEAIYSLSSKVSVYRGKVGKLGSSLGSIIRGQLLCNNLRLLFLSNHLKECNLSSQSMKTT